MTNEAIHVMNEAVTRYEEVLDRHLVAALVYRPLNLAMPTIFFFFGGCRSFPFRPRMPNTKRSFALCAALISCLYCLLSVHVRNQSIETNTTTVPSISESVLILRTVPDRKPISCWETTTREHYIL